MIEEFTKTRLSQKQKIGLAVTIFVIVAATIITLIAINKKGKNDKIAGVDMSLRPAPKTKPEYDSLVDHQQQWSTTPA